VGDDFNITVLTIQRREEEQKKYLRSSRIGSRRWGPNEDGPPGSRRTRQSGYERSQEQRAVCGSWAGQGGKGNSQGSHGRQSPDRRGHQDSGQNGGEIPSGKGDGQLRWNDSDIPADNPTAFQEVEDNLAALRILETEAQQQQARASAQESLQLFTNRYTGGAGTSLQVIGAQTVALQSERNNVDILRRRMDASALLINTLGGGWSATELPKEASLR
jgi:hypothetical protein